MAEFDEAIEFIIKNEGGYVNNPHDSGGSTNFGISLKFLKSLTPVDLSILPEDVVSAINECLENNDMAPKTIDRAKVIYEELFWKSARLSLIKFQKIATYVLDMCVHHGITQAIKILQRALWAAWGFQVVKDDGVFGIKTAGIIQKMPDVGELYLLAALRAERAGFCRLLSATRPKDKEFLDGWLKRCYFI